MKFPKEIMVKWEDAGNDEPFMSVGTEPDEMSDGPGETEVAVYRIVRRAKIVCRAEVVKK